MFWESKKDQLERYDKLKGEIATIKTKLDEYNLLKEEWFKKKEDLKKIISEKIKQVKSVKLKEDTSRGTISELKSQRSKYNDEVKKLISQIKLLNKEKEEAFKGYDLELNPSRIKDKIEDFERKIETEVISFKKEQKIMKQIKKLRAKYNQGEKINSILEKIRALSKSIEESKKKSEEVHKKIQINARENEGSYDGFIKLSREINNLRTEQEQAFNRFLNYKRTFLVLNSQLKEKIQDYYGLKKKFEKSKEYSLQQKQESDKKLIDQKTKEVEEKLKTKKKLTTDDLLIFQSGSK